MYAGIIILIWTFKEKIKGNLNLNYLVSAVKVVGQFLMMMEAGRRGCLLFTGFGQTKASKCKEQQSN